MTKCHYTKIGTCCRCKACAAMLDTAERIEARGCDLRDLREEYRPWVLFVRETRNPPRHLSPLGGVATITKGDDAGPWCENAVGELEDFDDGTPTA